MLHKKKISHLNFYFFFLNEEKILNAAFKAKKKLSILKNVLAIVTTKHSSDTLELYI